MYRAKMREKIAVKNEEPIKAPKTAFLNPYIVGELKQTTFSGFGMGPLCQISIKVSLFPAHGTPC